MCADVERPRTFQGPVIVGTYVLDCHAATVWLFAIIGSLNSIHSHGAYRFPMMPVPDAHDVHHSKFHWNFGTGPLDKVRVRAWCRVRGLGFP